MRNVMISAVVVLASLNSFAYQEKNIAMGEKLFNTENREEQNYFDTLGRLFKSGVTPDLNKLIDVAWAGRCFTKGQPSEPVNGGYMFRVAQQPDVGPLGSERKQQYEAVTYWNPGKLTDYYDSMDTSEALSALNDTDKFYKIEQNANAIEFSHTENGKTRLRLSGEYLVEEISGKEGKDVGPLDPPKYTAYIRCYYFIPEIAGQ